mmetsp:Transcript_79512/g.208806  ORF Transcript_79512/g.208806 Transcript_79512/m.208806 type:complete len:411 (+) Transcript_79512:1645-2877(+)
MSHVAAGQRGLQADGRAAARRPLRRALPAAGRRVLAGQRGRGRVRTEVPHLQRRDHQEPPAGGLQQRGGLPGSGLRRQGVVRLEELAGLQPQGQHCVRHEDLPKLHRGHAGPSPEGVPSWPRRLGAGHLGPGPGDEDEVRPEDHVEGLHQAGGRREAHLLGAGAPLHGAEPLRHPPPPDAERRAARPLPAGGRARRLPRGRAAEPPGGLHGGQPSLLRHGLLRGLPDLRAGAPARAQHRPPRPQARERAPGRDRVREALRPGLRALRPREDQHAGGDPGLHGAGDDRLPPRARQVRGLVRSRRVDLRAACGADPLGGRGHRRADGAAAGHPPEPGEGHPLLPVPFSEHREGFCQQPAAEAAASPRREGRPPCGARARDVSVSALRLPAVQRATHADAVPEGVQQPDLLHG